MKKYFKNSSLSFGIAIGPWLLIVWGYSILKLMNIVSTPMKLNPNYDPSWLSVCYETGETDFECLSEGLKFSEAHEYIDKYHYGYILIGLYITLYLIIQFAIYQKQSLEGGEHENN
jgi:hypothetical protein